MSSLLTVAFTVLLGTFQVAGQERPSAPETKPRDQAALKAQIEALQKERDALINELARLRVLAGTVIDVERVKERLHARIPKYRVFQQDPPRAPASQPMPGQPIGGFPPSDAEAVTRPMNPTTSGPLGAGQGGGRLLGDAERMGLPAGTVFTVDGSPVNRNEIDETVAYLRSYITDMTEAQIREIAMMEIIRVHAVEAAFKDRVPALKERIEAAKKKILVEKKDFDQVAKEMSECPTTKDKGGDLDFFGREQRREPSKPQPMVLPLQKAAFEAPIGEVVGPVVTEWGYHLIRVTGRTPGPSRIKDKVRASHILVLFDRNQDAINEIVTRANNGKVDLGFVDASYRGQAPAPFRK